MTEEQRLRWNALRRASDARRTDARRLNKATTLLAWKNANRERVVATRRKNLLFTKFNLTVEQWDVMLASQGYCCAICKTTVPGGKHKQWHTDHCHDTNKVRGILCNNCNMGIGLLGDKAANVRAAAAYLERAECPTIQQNNNRPSIPPTPPMGGQSKVLPFTGPVAKPSTNSSAETKSQNLSGPSRKSA